MNTVECPECGKVLKTANPIAPGKKVRCPGCKEIFTMPATKGKPPSSTAVRSKVAAPPKPPPDDDDDDEDIPRPKRRQRDEEEDIDDEDEEEDERPRKKKKKKKAAGPNWALIGGGGGGVLVLVLILGFVWPGFFKGGGIAAPGPAGAGGAGEANLLAYMPKGSQVLIGIDATRNAELAKALQDGIGTKIQQQMQQIPGAVGGMPPDVTTGLDASLRDAQRLVVGVDPSGAQGSGACAISTSKAVDIKQIAKAFKADGAAKDHQGKPYYTLPNGPPGGPPVFVGMPSGRVLLVGVMSEEEFKGLLASDGQQVQISADAQALVGPVSKSYMWATAMLSGELGAGLQMLNANMLPAELKPAAAALQKLKAVSFWADESPAKDQKVTIAVTCASDGDAAAVSGSLNALYQKQGRPMLGMLGLMAAQPGNEGLGDLVNEITKTLKIESQGAMAQASLSISEQTMKKMEKMQGQMMQQFGGIGGMPGQQPPGFGRPPGVPPPKVVPKKQ